MESLIANPPFWILPFGTFFATLALTPLVINLARTLGAVDRGGYRRMNRNQIPHLGGLAIVLPWLLAGMAGLMLIPAHPVPLCREIAFMLAGGSFITVLGVFDDLRQLQAKAKFLVQVLIAVLAWAGGIRFQVITLPLLGTIDLGLAGGAGVTVLWIVGMVNAFNLVDGVDGLATGLGLISALGIAGVALLGGHLPLTWLCLGLAGGLAAFLIFNYFPARIFLGDTGSLFIGFTLAVLALLASVRPSGAVSLFTPALLLAVPIFDTTVAFARRLLRGRSPFIGDSSHTHHRLLETGFTQRQLTAVLYGIALFGVTAAYVDELSPTTPGWQLLAMGAFILALGVLSQLSGYLRPRHARNVSRCRQRNKLLQSFSRFAALSFRNHPSSGNMEDLLHLACREMRLNLLEVDAIGDAGEPEADSPVIRVGALIPSVAGNGAFEAEPLQTMQVEDAAGQSFVLRLQFARPAGALQDWDAQDADSLERQDVEACLAHFFNIIRLDSLQPRPDAARIVAEAPPSEAPFAERKRAVG